MCTIQLCYFHFIVCNSFKYSVIHDFGNAFFVQSPTLAVSPHLCYRGWVIQIGLILNRRWMTFEKRLIFTKEILFIRCIYSVWPRPFWVGAPPSPPNGTPTCPGLISQRRALISKRIALICPGQWAPSSYARGRCPAGRLCWSALPFKVLSAYSRSNTGSVQNHQKPDEDHKTDPRFLFCGVPRW